MNESIQLTRKASTRDLYFEEPVLIKDIVPSKNGHTAFQVVNANGVALTLNLPDWFKDQYVDSGRAVAGDYISGGWNDGRFVADIWQVVE